MFFKTRYRKIALRNGSFNLVSSLIVVRVLTERFSSPSGKRVQQRLFQSHIPALFLAQSRHPSLSISSRFVEIKRSHPAPVKIFIPTCLIRVGVLRVPSVTWSDFLFFIPCPISIPFLTLIPHTAKRILDSPLAPARTVIQSLILAILCQS